MAGDIEEWLRAWGLEQYAGSFAENDLDWDLILELGETDLEKIGITSLGHRKRLLKAIDRRRRDLRIAREAAAQQIPPAPLPTRSDPERRQMSVMFCDLVGSTPLSVRLDPEELSEVLRRYRDIVAKPIHHYGGHIVQYLGDGVLACFGWPQAHEDQAVRAIMAGLDALANVQRAKPVAGARLSARVGIASGEVVVGDLIGDESRDAHAITGETTNRAYRLQDHARQNELVIDGQTARLVGSTFDLEDLGPLPLKGFNDPVPSWRVLGPGRAEDRFTNLHPGRLSRFIDREHELALIRERWMLAKRSEGQAVLLSGEAGIGKSRTLEALRDELHRESYARLRFQCSSMHTNSTLHPVIQFLQRSIGFTANPDDALRLKRLRGLLRLSSPAIEHDTPLFAALLSLQLDREDAARPLTPQQARERTIDSLIRGLIELSRRRPVLLVLEDAHWIDPTTEALVGEALPRIADARIFMVITYRPDYAPPWVDLPHLARIHLNRLSRDQGAELVEDIGGDLAARVVEQIVARADGVPFFVEELTKSFIESGEREREVPRSLHAPLNAKLDRLGEAAKLAQLAAVIGRAFDYRFLQAVSELETRDLDRALTAMKEGGLLGQRGTPPNARYYFKHSLFQDAAYGTLLRSNRIRYHGRVADVLLRDFADQAAAEPEVVARHLSLARSPQRAVAYWWLASRRASDRSAHVETLAHVQDGIRELDKLPGSPARDDQELALRLAAGTSLGALKGWASPEAEKNYRRAYEIAAPDRDTRTYLLTLGGLANVFILRGEIKQARKLADDELALAEGQDDVSLLRTGHRFVGMCSFLVGDFAAARDHLRQGGADDRQSGERGNQSLYGTDPAVISLSILAWTHWFLGEFSAARSNIAAAIAVAEEHRHPYSLAYAHSLAASLHQVFREPRAVLDQAEAALAVAKEQDFPYWLGWSTVMRGWAEAALGEPKAGIKTVRRGLDIYKGTGARQVVPYIFTLLAEMHGWAGSPKKGLKALKGAHGRGNATDVRFYEPEALRIRGELRRQSKSGDGRASFTRALALARKQGARALELRAAVSAGRASLEGGDPAAAHAELTKICQAFDTDLQDPDLIDARNLLTALSAA